MIEQKTLILSAIDNSNKKAVVNITQIEDSYSGSIRLYNFKETPKGILTLAFLFGSDVCKAGLSEKSHQLYSFDLKADKITEKFSCALINILSGVATPLLCGASDGKSSSDLTQALVNNFDLLDDTHLTAKKVAERLDLEAINYNEEDAAEIENTINCEMGPKDKCAHCNYRNAFYNSYGKIETVKNEQINFFTDYTQKENDFTSQNLSSKSSHDIQESDYKENSFYDEIKGQLTILFDKYPEETFLNEIIPDSKWIKVDYEDTGHYFVIGLLYENNKVQYVCYGMPGEFSIKPPREFNGMSQWLPLDPEKPEELGYWLMYQDADTGENVEIKIS